MAACFWLSSVSTAKLKKLNGAPDNFLIALENGIKAEVG